MKLTKTLEATLREIAEYRAGYPWNWKTKTREKLEALGLVEFKTVNWRGTKVYGLTEAGQEVLNGL